MDFALAGTTCVTNDINFGRRFLINANVRDEITATCKHLASIAPSEQGASESVWLLLHSPQNYYVQHVDT